MQITESRSTNIGIIGPVETLDDSNFKTAFRLFNHLSDVMPDVLLVFFSSIKQLDVYTADPNQTLDALVVIDNPATAEGLSVAPRIFDLSELRRRPQPNIIYQSDTNLPIPWLQDKRGLPIVQVHTQEEIIDQIKRMEQTDKQQLPQKRSPLSRFFKTTSRLRELLANLNQ